MTETKTRSIMEIYKDLPAQLDPRGYTYAELALWLGIAKNTLATKIWKHNAARHRVAMDSGLHLAPAKITPTAIDESPPHNYYFSPEAARSIRDLVQAPRAPRKGRQAKTTPSQETAS